MAEVTVKRSNITLSEEREFSYPGDATHDVRWIANLHGKSSTGEWVSMDRSATHAGEALLVLTEALKEEGYVVQ